MTVESTRTLARLADALVEALTAAALSADDLRATVYRELADLPECPVASVNGTAGRRPLLDESTAMLTWEGRTCRLGFTLTYRLAERLFRRPNHYINPDHLLRDVWKATRSDDTIRSAVRNLRRRLKASGMERLAEAIQCRGGRYGLILDSTA